jgi:hypothetical protein
MKKSETISGLNIYQKLLNIQKAIVGLAKDKKSFNYSYVTGDKVLEHIKPLMNEYGLLLKQEVLSIENTRQDYAGKSGLISEMNSKVMMRFTWVDCETGEKDENLFGANGQNSWDKGVGSALTYAERYFLLKFFHIATDEDDIDNADRGGAKQQPQQQQKQEPIANIARPNAPQPTMQAVRTETPSEFEEPAQPIADVAPITSLQKEEIIRLINNIQITRQEKTKTLLNINKISSERAIQMIETLKNVIADRESQKQEVPQETEPPF